MISSSSRLGDFIVSFVLSALINVIKSALKIKDTVEYTEGDLIQNELKSLKKEIEHELQNREQ